MQTVIALYGVAGTSQEAWWIGWSMDVKSSHTQPARKGTSLTKALGKQFEQIFLSIN